MRGRPGAWWAASDRTVHSEYKCLSLAVSPRNVSHWGRRETVSKEHDLAQMMVALVHVPVSGMLLECLPVCKGRP